MPSIPVLLTSAAMLLPPGLAALQGLRSTFRDRSRRAAPVPDALIAGASFPPGTAPQPVDTGVYNAVTDVLRLLDRLASLQSVRVQMDVPAGLRVHADPRALRHALSAVIAGAMHAAPCGELLIIARPAIVAEGAAGRILICIDDDGGASSRPDLHAAGPACAALGTTLQIRMTPGAGTSIAMELPAATRGATLNVPWNATIERSMSAFHAVVSATPARAAEAGHPEQSQSAGKLPVAPVLAAAGHSG